MVEKVVVAAVFYLGKCLPGVNAALSLNDYPILSCV